MSKATEVRVATFRLSLVTLALSIVIGCNSRPSASGERSLAAGFDNSNGAKIDVMCIADRINTPTYPFHYSYKYDGSFGQVEKEADITPQTMEITIKDKSGLRSFHGVRSDEQSWNNAVINLSNLSIPAMASRLGSLDGTSAVVQNGPEAINGYSTTKYAIDTANANSADKKRWETLVSQGSFEQGTAWIPADGCAVKLILDEGMWQS